MSSANSTGEGQRPSRARGRELALWLLCHLESHAGGEREAAELFWREAPTLDAEDEFLIPNGPQLEALLADGGARRWARALTVSYLDTLGETDAALESASKRWRVARMDRVDRNLLRLCAVELSKHDTPRNVVVSEVVRLAARYGSERSSSFVNGVAEALARTMRDGAGESGS